MSASTFLQGAVLGTDTSSYTFSGLSFGAASAGRVLVAVISARGTGTTATISSVTIGGVTATSAAESLNTTGGNTSRAAVYYAVVATGTSGDVVVTFSAGQQRCGVSLYSLTGVDDPTPLATSTLTAGGTFGSFSLSAQAHVITGAFDSSNGSIDQHTSASLGRMPATSPAISFASDSGAVPAIWRGVSRDYANALEGAYSGQSAAVAVAFPAQQGSVSPIEFVGGATENSVAASGTVLFSALTGGIGGGVVTGDVVVVGVGMNPTSDVAVAMTTSGYTSLAADFQSAPWPADDAIFYKVMGGTPDTDVVVNTVSTTDEHAIAVMVFRGVHSSPIDASATRGGGTGTGIPDPGAVTVINAKAMVVFLGVGGASAASAGLRHTAPYLLNPVIGGTVRWGHLGLGAIPALTAGGYDPAPFTSATSSSSAGYYSATFSLRPVASAYSFNATGSTAFAMSAPDAILTVGGPKILGDSGTFVMTGTAATLTYARIVSKAEFQQGAVSTTDATSYTFSSMAFGADHSTRLILAVISARGSGTTSNISSVTIGGVSATSLVTAANTGGGNTSRASAFVAAVPTGATGDVVVAFTGTQSRCGLSVYRLENVSATPLVTSTLTANGTFGSFSLSSDAHVITGAYNGTTATTAGRHTSASLGRKATTSSNVSYTGGTTATGGGVTVWGGVRLDYDADIETATSANSAAVAVAFTALDGSVPPIQYVGGLTAAGAASSRTLTFSSITGGISNTVLSGDVVVVAVSYGASVAASMTTAGYTSVATLLSGGTNTSDHAVWYKVMGSTPDTSVVINTVDASFNAHGAAISIWRGVDGVTPLDVTSTTATGTTGGLPNPPSITTVTDNAMIVYTGARSGTSASTGLRTPAPYLTHIGFGSISTFGGQAMAGTPQAVAGAFDPAAFTAGTGTFTGWSATTMALRAALPSSGVSYDATANQTFSLTGTANSFRRGWVYDATASRAFSLTGFAADFYLGKGFTADSAAYVLTGTDAEIRYGNAMPAASGTFVLTGTAATFPLGKVFPAATATFTLTGTDATFKRGLVMPATGAAFVLTGTDIAFATAGKIIVDSGSFVLTGSPAGLYYGRRVDTAPATSFVLTGTAAGLLRGFRYDATAAQTFSLTGTANSFRRTLIMPAVSAAYTFTGFDVSFFGGRHMAANSGAFVLTGTAATLRRDLMLPALSGSFMLAGQDVTFWKGVFPLVAESGTFILTGWNTTGGATTYTIDLTGSGTFLLNGYDAMILGGRRASVGRGCDHVMPTRPAQISAGTRPAQISRVC